MDSTQAIRSHTCHNRQRRTEWLNRILNTLVTFSVSSIGGFSMRPNPITGPDSNHRAITLPVLVGSRGTGFAVAKGGEGITFQLGDHV